MFYIDSGSARTKWFYDYHYSFNQYGHSTKKQSKNQRELEVLEENITQKTILNFELI